VPDADATERIAATLHRDGVSVTDGFLDDSGLAALAACAEARHARGEFAAARIGSGRAPQRRAQIRGDSICWLAAPLFAAETRLLNGLEALRLALNREALLGLFDLELHYVDQPRGTADRQVSLALYLNNKWQPAHGGELRLFDAQGGYRDVVPLGGRLVCFLTQGCEHAVQPAARVRLSLSGWFRRRAA
jgi:SM-20-related protein